MGKYGKLWKGMVRFEKVLEGIEIYEKVWGSMGRYEKVCEVMERHGNI